VIAAAMPRFAELGEREAQRFNVILVHCDERSMLSPPYADAIRRMSTLTPIVAVIESPTPEASLSAARIGFQGLVSREVSPRALDRVIEAVLRGEFAFPRSTLSMLARSTVDQRVAGAGLRLTPRQQQVAELIADGATDSEIGEALGISRSTAHKHVLGAFRRLKVRNRSQLVAAVGAATRAQPTHAVAASRAGADRSR
jgi:DNA-binding NarL/FixJ family response regulator